jgi:hypothetical protein
MPQYTWLTNLFKVHRNSGAAVAAMLGLVILYAGVALTAQNPAGGQDSWNHYLFARWCFKHPQLMLDLWAKPFFTILAAPFAQISINAVYWVNVTATLATAWLTYLTGRKLGMRNPWILILLFGLQPVVLANAYSALTEPTNALVLSIILYLFASHRFKSALIIASFLPLVRSEGLVMIACITPYVIAHGQWKKLFWLISGTLVFAILGAIITGEWNYFIEHNPYIRFEKEGTFDPGHGSMLHYLQSQRFITGILITVLIVLAILLAIQYIVNRWKKKAPQEMSQMLVWIWLPLFLGYGFVHSFIWWTGTMGSHGLSRVFMAVAPLAALIAHFAIHRLMTFDLRAMNIALKILIVSGCFFIAFPGAEMPFPWNWGSQAAIKESPGNAAIDRALNYIDSAGLGGHPLVHQLPQINVKKDWDPFEERANVTSSATFYISSINKRPGQDWLPDSALVLWDNFHARRDASMTLGDMRKLSAYKEIAYFPSSADTIYEMRIFIKTR